MRRLVANYGDLQTELKINLICNAKGQTGLSEVNYNKWSKCEHNLRQAQRRLLFYIDGSIVN